MTKLTSVVAASIKHGQDNRPISSVLADAYVRVSTRTTKNVPDIQAVPFFAATGTNTQRSKGQVQVLLWIHISIAQVDADDVLRYCITKLSMGPSRWSCVKSAWWAAAGSTGARRHHKLLISTEGT